MTNLFEVSWEVCNKVGGINTVIRSKANLVTKKYGSNYYLIGPYFEEHADLELEMKKVPTHLKKVFETLKKEGIKCYFGIWNIKGDPQTILIDFSSMINKKNEIKKFYWDYFKIDSLFSAWDFEEPMLFSTAVAKLLEEFEKEANKKNDSIDIVAQFHEWITGFGLLHLKQMNSKIATVFTTHATILGRSIASNQDLYGMLENINPEKMAYDLNIQDKFSAEKASAQNCDVFTTVSDITGLEAEKILGRKPDVLLYNGLSMKKFPTVEETSIKHVISREAIREFIAYYFFPYYSFNLEHSLIYYTSARYEFRNKGMDILIPALKKLNEKLKEENSKRTICFMFWIPMAPMPVKKSLIENKNYYYHIKNHVDWHAQKILRELTFDFLKDTTMKVPENLFTIQFLKELKKDVTQFKRKGNPSICTHEINKNDALYKGLLEAGLDNKPDDNVKVIIYPVYLEGSDSLLNLPYYDAVVGTHLGVFPSYYEPWGYTPLESAALAVPAITTDLAGFGNFVQQQKLKKGGVFILPRFNKSRQEEIDSLYKLLYNYSLLDHSERVNNKLLAKNIALLAEWDHFVKNYFVAYEKALKLKRLKN